MSKSTPLRSELQCVAPKPNPPRAAASEQPEASPPEAETCAFRRSLVCDRFVPASARQPAPAPAPVAAPAPAPVEASSPESKLRTLMLRGLTFVAGIFYEDIIEG